MNAPGRSRFIVFTLTCSPIPTSRVPEITVPYSAVGCLWGRGAPPVGMRVRTVYRPGFPGSPLSNADVDREFASAIQGNSSEFRKV